MTCGIVRIRLARFGRTNNPVYNIVVANARRARDAKPLEVLGTYNPIPQLITVKQKKRGMIPEKKVNLDFGRTQYWIGVGAQPSDSVTKLLKKCGILDEAWGRNSEREIIKPRVESYE
ncbi:similar to Saccharomyces cerevisiae YPL013C MRPS16 Mitochondrial ribosomal protein of the small subunit [Maudiozyma barnettii]|uniref:Similar to Saccharomyces cerevisiae YPL013C MRPS16 Mitochondrial ribosomal protein of the small subunit n=1 Tax=Maudiozyma barnettii TaxID=61262 RepID=A0A8H2VF29_9SACH|nr:mitochondrial 37S ribosomal protein MRPS16 [Kazachstania barnettii]CAB4254390.1 similar to Saccharomyces cerevisiae YPL013C MRPS16 Mitochondrial ribosomal protein of the small subunit [Kazachstania barnettii]CAD1782291.1 similar to Saccharomyces cerevisiae YPL013C MRPS16 Mitochondrial ribosomal protein of the small subunit [Kazachstania barnettii]